MPRPADDRGRRERQALARQFCKGARIARRHGRLDVAEASERMARRIAEALTKQITEGERA